MLILIDKNLHIVEIGHDSVAINEHFYRMGNYLTLLMYKLSYYDEINDDFFIRQLCNVIFFNEYLIKIIKRYYLKGRNCMVNDFILFIRPHK